MCTPTVKRRLDQQHVSPNNTRNAPKTRTKKRPRQQQQKVHFSSSVAQTHVVEKFATPYSQRHLWYNKQELQRAQQMDVRRNLVAGDLVDTPHADLTWRGLEQHQPGHSQRRKLPTARAHAAAIVQEYRNQCKGEWHEDDLASLSESLSCEHRLEALQRAWQDQKAVKGGKTETAVVVAARPAPKHQLVRSHSRRRRHSGTSFGLHHSIQQVPLIETFLWLMRVVTFFLLCGVLFAK